MYEDFHSSRCTIGIKDTGSAIIVNDVCGKHVVVSTTPVVIKGNILPLMTTDVFDTTACLPQVSGTKLHNTLEKKSF
jgi:hypothetical protein